jgi:RNA polymerase sigma factor (sigma-70 family)
MAEAAKGMRRERAAAGEDAPCREALLQACLAGDEAARGRFVEEFSGLVVWALRVTFRRYDRPLGEEDEHDLTHDIFLALFLDDARRLRQYDGRGGATFATWLRVVVTRFAIDRLRRPERTVSLDDPAIVQTRAIDEAGNDPLGGPETQALAADRRRRIRALVAELAPNDRLFVRLFYFEGLSVEEAAAVLGITRNAAYVRKMRLHGRLRTLVETRYEEGL